MAGQAAAGRAARELGRVIEDVVHRLCVPVVVGQRPETESGLDGPQKAVVGVARHEV